MIINRLMQETIKNCLPLRTELVEDRLKHILDDGFEICGGVLGFKKYGEKSPCNDEAYRASFENDFDMMVWECASLEIHPDMFMPWQYQDDLLVNTSLPLTVMHRMMVKFLEEEFGESLLTTLTFSNNPPISRGSEK